MRGEMENESISFDDIQQDGVLPSSKKLKKTDDNPFGTDASFMPNFRVKRNEFQFTQWFQDQVDEFNRNSCEINKTGLVKEILSSVSYYNVLSPKKKLSNSQQESVPIQEFTS